MTRRAGGFPISLASALLAAVMLVTSCGTTGTGAAPEDEFTFVSPGGQTRFFYPPGERGRVTGLNGESLLNKGEQISLSQFKGKVVVLNVWGSWCPPCRREASDLQAVQDKTKSQGVQFLGIDVRDDRTAAADFHRDRGLTYPSIYDASGRTMLALNEFPRSAVPATIVLDREHRVAAIFLTDLLESDLLPHVRRIAAEGSARD